MDEEDAAKQLDVDMEKDVVTCEMPFGSVLFLNNIIPHRQASTSVSCLRQQRYSKCLQDDSVSADAASAEKLGPCKTFQDGQLPSLEHQRNTI